MGSRYRREYGRWPAWKYTRTGDNAATITCPHCTGRLMIALRRWVQGVRETQGNVRICPYCGGYGKIPEALRKYAHK